MAKRLAVNTKRKTSRSKKTKKRLAIKHARLAALELKRAKGPRGKKKARR